MPVDPKTLARELTAAYANRQPIATPSSRYPEFDLVSAYAVEAELVRIRGASGHAAIGRKVGYANKAIWRVLKLDTLAWAHMYDDTVHHARNGETSLSLTRMYSPKIEPEIVFKLKAGAGPFQRRSGAAAFAPSALRRASPELVSGPPERRRESPALQAADALDACEWIALGFEIIDCVFPAWQYQPADFVAAFGLHAALVVGEPRPIEPAMVDDLPRFTVRLLRDGQLAAEGSGRNVLRSPAACLGELAAATSRGPGADPLAGDEVISTGSMTESQPIAVGETWNAQLDGLALPALTLRVER